MAEETTPQIPPEWRDDFESRVHQEVAGAARAHGRVTRELMMLRRSMPLAVTAAFVLGLMLGFYAPLVTRLAPWVDPGPSLVDSCGETWCTNWIPTGQTCPNGCKWERTCRDDCDVWLQTACWPSQSGCPLVAPGDPVSEHILQEWMEGEGLRVDEGVFYAIDSGKPVIPVADNREQGK